MHKQFILRARAYDAMMARPRVIFSEFADRVFFKPLITGDPAGDEWLTDADVISGIEPIESFERHSSPAIFYSVSSEDWPSERGYLTRAFGFNTFDEVTR